MDMGRCRGCRRTDGITLVMGSGRLEEYEGEKGAPLLEGSKSCSNTYTPRYTWERELIRPLGESLENSSQASGKAAKLVALCKNELNSVTGVSQHGACARYVSLCYKGSFGGCGRLVKRGPHSNFSRRSGARNPCYEPGRYTACSSGGPEEWVPAEPDNWPGNYQTTPSPGWDPVPVPEGAFA